MTFKIELTFSMEYGDIPVIVWIIAKRMRFFIFSTAHLTARYLSAKRINNLEMFASLRVSRLLR